MLVGATAARAIRKSMQPNTAGLLFALAAMAGCAMPARPPVPTAGSQVRAASRVAAQSGEIGTVLAIHRVAAGDSPARRILVRVSAATSAGEAEYIVRAADGGTIAIVQPVISDLRRGDRVSILRGAPTVIESRLRPAGG